MKRRCTLITGAGRERERKTEGWNASNAGSYRETGDTRRTVGCWQCCPPKVMIYQPYGISNIQLNLPRSRDEWTMDANNNVRHLLAALGYKATCIVHCAFGFCLSTSVLPSSSGKTRHEVYKVNMHASDTLVENLSYRVSTTACVQNRRKIIDRQRGIRFVVEVRHRHSAPLPKIGRSTEGRRSPAFRFCERSRWTSLKKTRSSETDERSACSGQRPTRLSCGNTEYSVIPLRVAYISDDVFLRYTYIHHAHPRCSDLTRGRGFTENGNRVVNCAFCRFDDTCEQIAARPKVRGVYARVSRGLKYPPTRRRIGIKQTRYRSKLL
ncbi:hypothetical protein DBV15_04471 [Temnothorax longispinosus]|uniref:Uncharacterized protein n=1 Tax=Temnothorax longispinosus TaxID=300112 RepID=A0A4S2KAS9_9HYME|nr:hypothetical protein DBV15_04471 [Temnothorax longispinosus]